MSDLLCAANVNNHTEGKNENKAPRERVINQVEAQTIILTSALKAYPSSLCYDIVLWTIITQKD